LHLAVCCLLLLLVACCLVPGACCLLTADCWIFPVVHFPLMSYHPCSGMVVFVADYYGMNNDDTNKTQIKTALTQVYPAFLADTDKAQRIAKLSLSQLTKLPNVRFVS
jgi:hypothetical protein